MIGPKAGKNMKFVAKACGALDQDDINSIQSQGKIDLQLDNGETFELLLEEVVIQSTDMPGWQVVSEQGLTVALDMTITEELEQEGLAREFVNRIQNLRKAKDFQVTDFIEVTVSHNDKIKLAIEAFNDYICGEILASKITFTQGFSSDENIELDDVELSVGLTKS